MQCVEENYDIPRSHHLPYYNMNNNSTSTAANDQNVALTPTSGELSATVSLAGSTSTLNSSTLQRGRSHFYTNAAPAKVEGNVFRYDFDEVCNRPSKWWFTKKQTKILTRKSIHFFFPANRSFSTSCRSQTKTEIKSSGRNRGEKCHNDTTNETITAHVDNIDCVFCPINWCGHQHWYEAAKYRSKIETSYTRQGMHIAHVIFHHNHNHSNFEIYCAVRNGLIASSWRTIKSLIRRINQLHGIPHRSECGQIFQNTSA